MTCNCPPLSAFRWREHLQPSRWASDPEVKYSEKSGKTRSQIATETKDQTELRTGRSLGEIHRLSKKERNGC